MQFSTQNIVNLPHRTFYIWQISNLNFVTCIRISSTKATAQKLIRGTILRKQIRPKGGWAGASERSSAAWNSHIISASELIARTESFRHKPRQIPALKYGHVSLFLTKAISTFVSRLFLWKEQILDNALKSNSLAASSRKLGTFECLSKIKLLAEETEKDTSVLPAFLFELNFELSCAENSKETFSLGDVGRVYLGIFVVVLESFR